jgi:hypothetical protein
VELPHLEAAINDVVARHDSMRVVFDASGQEQRVLGSVHVPLEVVELPACGPEGLDTFLSQPHLREFDFTRGPLWRFLVVREAPTTLHLVVSCSDLMADGTSLVLVLRQMASAYSARVSAEPAPTSACLQVGEHLARCASSEHDEFVDACREYWRAELAGAPAMCSLPERTARPAVKGTKVRRLHGQIPAGLHGSLVATARSEGVTLFSLLLASFGALVHRIGGIDDVVIGVPTFGRFGRGDDTLVANCARPMPVRLRTSPTDRVGDLARATQRKVMDAQDNAGCTTGDVARMAGNRRDLSASPLFQLLFNLDPVGTLPDFGVGVRATVEPVPEEHGLMDLAVQVTPTLAGGLLASFDYDPELFDDDMVRSWVDCYTAILGHVAAEPQTALEELHLGGPR